MSPAYPVHPVVQRTLDLAAAGRDLISSTLESVSAASEGLINDDGDIAVKVDHRGQLLDLWLKPGVLDTKRASIIAKEIATLVSAATQAARNAASVAFTTTSEQLGELAKSFPEEFEYFPYGSIEPRLDGP